MGIEIERKFLVKSEDWRQDLWITTPVQITQGYLCLDPERTVRVRVRNYNNAVLTIKGKGLDRCSRPEYEYKIPLKDGINLINMCVKNLIHKFRHKVKYSGKLWEVDVFSSPNDGLVIAELELEHVDETFEKPPWLGEEITESPSYYNASLAKHPYESWSPMKKMLVNAATRKLNGSLQPMLKEARASVALSLDPEMPQSKFSKEMQKNILSKKQVLEEWDNIYNNRWVIEIKTEVDDSNPLGIVSNSDPKIIRDYLLIMCKESPLAYFHIIDQEKDVRTWVNTEEQIENWYKEI